MLNVLCFSQTSDSSGQLQIEFYYILLYLQCKYTILVVLFSYVAQNSIFIQSNHNRLNWESWW